MGFAMATQHAETVMRALTRDTSDADLLARFRVHRDEAALAELVQRHARLVRAATGRVLHNPADIDDATQATFLVLVRRAATLPARTGIGPWLYGVAHRIAVRVRARNRLRPAPLDATEPISDTQLPDPSWRETCDALHAELDRLPDRYRLPLLLCYLEGQTRDEAATALELSAGTVKGRVRRGIEMLRRRLERRGVTLPAGLLAAVAASHSSPSAGMGKPAMIRFGAHSTRASELAKEVAVGTTVRKWAAGVSAVGVLCAGAAIVAAFGAGHRPGAPAVHLPQMQPLVVRAPVPKNPPAVTQLPQLPDNVRTAWEKAGVEVGWLHVTSSGRHSFRLKNPDPGDLPAFQFSDLPRFTDLPAPDVPFGVRLYCTAVRAADLKPLAKMKNLRRLCFEGVPRLSDEVLAELARFEHLAALNISFRSCPNTLTAAGFKALGVSKSLKELALDGGISLPNPVRLNDGQGLDNLKNLRVLSLINCAAPDGVFREIGTLTDLQRLSLDDTPLTDGHAAEVGKLKQLRALHVNALGPALAALTASGFRLLGALTELRVLSLSNGTLTDEGLKHLAGLKNLRELDLSETHVTGAGMVHLAGMVELRDLHLGRTGVTDTGMQHLAALKKLEFLSLYRTEITDEGLTHVAKLSSLKKLDLSSSAISNAGLKRLGGLTALEYLYLSENGLTNAGVRHLLVLKKLRYVDLWATKTYGTPEREALLNEARKALPGCQFNTQSPL